MNYPVWEIPAIGGGVLIAVIAVLHVYIAHLAVGGGLFLVWTERKARRENDEPLLGYVKRHTGFFLLLTMVFGGLTGVGIWFIISLVHPAATSSLIHNFVFGWAIEWTFFVGEIIALLLYHYLFDRLSPRVHMIVGWLYFAFAWLSLVVINGILSYMLTPGRWLETGNMWHGFFNPTYFPSLVFRTGIALVFAGVFGLVTAMRERDPAFRGRLVHYCARWLVLPLFVVVLSGLWYWSAVPEGPLENLLRRNPEADVFVQVLLVSTGLLFLGGLVLLLRLPRGVQGVLTALLVAIGLGWMGGFEYLREIARKPFVIYDHMYSTSIPVTEADRIAEEGFLAHARWVEHHEVTAENRLEAGRELFRHQCLICHTVGGYNDILPRTEVYDEFGLTAKLTGMGRINTYMPPFLGTAEERGALAAYIVQELQGKSSGKPVVPEVIPEPVETPPFDAETAEYVLLAWNDLGMHCITDSDPFFVLLPPANTLWAQLVKRGPVPEVVTDGVEIRYRVQPGYENPQDHVRFWEFSARTFGTALEPPLGLFGKGIEGTFDPVDGAFTAPGIPVVPYRDDGTYNPYPLFTVEARDVDTGALLAETKVVAPVSTEFGCKNCHGGDWAHGGRAGVTAVTAENILRVHDRMSGTDLLAESRAGRPRLCQECHADPALGAQGDPERLNLSAAVHGFHAHQMAGQEAEACAACHPARQAGVTRCLRGRHGEAEVTCVDCHGTLEDHALSLLVAEKEAGKPEADRLMRNLAPRTVDDVAEIHGRTPWVNEPDCLTCHVDFSLEEFSAFNVWVEEFEDLYRNRTGEAGIRCIACHGSTHALYPASNLYGKDRDNIQPLQYQGIAGTIGTEGNCAVCHTEAMEDELHHENMLP